MSDLHQNGWFEAAFDGRLGEYVLVAMQDGRVVGFLRCAIQAIGVEEDRAPVTIGGEVLREGKVLTFGVARSERGKGIGRALQERLIADSRAMG